MLAALFGLSGPTFARYLNGQSYPTLQSMQKFEVVMGWPVSEQVQLIPPYWEWPVQNVHNTGNRGEPTDYRYATKLDQIVREWSAANPRTVLASEVRQHPNIPSRAGAKPTPEFQARRRPLVKK